MLEFDDAAAKGVERIYQTPDVVGQRARFLRALDLQPGERVLDVGAGPGLLAHDMAGAVGEGGRVAGIDLSEPMLAMSRGRCAEQPWTDFRVGDATKLPFDDESFDAVVCQFGIMFFPDKARGVAEMARVLKSGGLIAFNVWDSIEQNNVVRIAHETISGFFDAAPPSFLETPFGYFETEPVKRLMDAAGFDRVSCDVVSEIVERPDARHIARGFVEGNPGIHEIRTRASADAATIIEAVAEAIDAEFGPPPVAIPLQEIVYTGIKMR